MNVFEAVRTVLAVRSYADRPVPDETVQRIVESAHLTASSINKQPWHFIVVRDRERMRKIAPLARTGPYIADAQMAIVVAVEKESRYGVSDASRAIQDMMLTAWEDGVGSNWVGFGGMTEVGDLLGVPTDYDVLAVVPFGYPAKPGGRGKKRRKPIGEVVSQERFGQPYS